jgi:hypothetical protein
VVRQHTFLKQEDDQGLLERRFRPFLLVTWFSASLCFFQGIYMAMSQVAEPPIASEPPSSTILIAHAASEAITSKMKGSQEYIYSHLAQDLINNYVSLFTPRGPSPTRPSLPNNSNADSDLKFQHRILVAIAGIPGSGKTTMATEVCKRVNEKAHNDVELSRLEGSSRSIRQDIAVVVPMDGFHLTRGKIVSVLQRTSAVLHNGMTSLNKYNSQGPFYSPTKSNA